jgi:hypothetical protein
MKFKHLIKKLLLKINFYLEIDTVYIKKSIHEVNC